MKEYRNIRKIIATIFGILFVAAVISLGAYATGLLDGDKLFHADNMEYSSGGFNFSGSLKSGLFTGTGTITFQDGSSYSGGFADGRFNGKAVFTFSGDLNESGWSFEGIFQNGRASSGTFYLNGGQAIDYSYDQNDDALISSVWQYSGRLNERGQVGIGTFTFEDGSVYKGGFLNGSANGEGTFTDSTGSTIYAGSFSDGAFEGHGTYYSPDGWVYEGSFKNGEFDGEGQITGNSFVTSGIWEKGIQISRYE